MINCYECKDLGAEPCCLHCGKPLSQRLKLDPDSLTDIWVKHHKGPDDLDNFQTAVRQKDKMAMRFYGAKLKEQGASEKFLWVVICMTVLSVFLAFFMGEF